MKTSIDASRLSLTLALAPVLALIVLAMTASAQTRTSITTETTALATTTRTITPLYDESSGAGMTAGAHDGAEDASGLDYLNAPEHVFVAHLDDYVTDPAYYDNHLSEYGYEGWRNVKLYVHALNPSSETTKVRVQAFDDAGRRWIERDYEIAPMHRVSLVDPDLPDQFEEVYTASNMPTVFVISSDAPIKIRARSVLRSGFINYDDDRQSASDSSRGVRFDEVDCDEAGHHAICSQWVRWNDWAEWAN